MLCLSGWGSVILLLIGKFVGIMFIAFVGVLLDDIFNSVGEDAFTTVRSGKQTSETVRYLSRLILI